MRKDTESLEPQKKATSPRSATNDRRQMDLKKVLICGAGYWAEEFLIPGLMANSNKRDIPELRVKVLSAEATRPDWLPNCIDYISQHDKGALASLASEGRWELVLSALPHGEQLATVELLTSSGVVGPGSLIALQKPACSGPKQADQFERASEGSMRGLELVMADHYFVRVRRSRAYQNGPHGSIEAVTIQLWEKEHVTQENFDVHHSKEGIHNWLSGHALAALASFAGPINKIRPWQVRQWAKNRDLLGKTPTEAEIFATVETEKGKFPVLISVGKGMEKNLKQMVVNFEGPSSNGKALEPEVISLASSEEARHMESELLIEQILKGQTDAVTLSLDEALASVRSTHQFFDLGNRSTF